MLADVRILLHGGAAAWAGPATAQGAALGNLALC